SRTSAQPLQSPETSISWSAPSLCGRGFIPCDRTLSRAARKGAYGLRIWQNLRLTGSFPCQQKKLLQPTGGHDSGPESGANDRVFYGWIGPAFSPMEPSHREF